MPLCLGLLALLLAPSRAYALDAPPRAAAEPCAFNTMYGDIAQDSQECAFLKGLETDFSRLSSAAGFRPGEVGFDRELSRGSKETPSPGA